eukprot:gnl/TRDRNA2_/TRDRNA2_125568_c0_seq2.p2 gnl/TRDRNA2_/TRDRNA2_125568_c0~~gnl/TRDRNA2_/TRDRNA2_125568_c0_seq2.p2  ORF type:complete len:118 (+),score=12.15 gnl/TRDRNA2_/TRDRNA2_125568_c0_seq2:506-859(+)
MTLPTFASVQERSCCSCFGCDSGSDSFVYFCCGFFFSAAPRPTPLPASRPPDQVAASKAALATWAKQGAAGFLGSGGCRCCRRCSVEAPPFAVVGLSLLWRCSTTLASKAWTDQLNS